MCNTTSTSQIYSLACERYLTYLLLLVNNIKLERDVNTFVPAINMLYRESVPSEEYCMIASVKKPAYASITPEFVNRVKGARKLSSNEQSALNFWMKYINSTSRGFAE